MKVFVSSTVYDLVDARAEVEALLTEMHLTPVLSDSSSAYFQITPDRNSVECCLVNLRQCDAVILMLSQRYGPALPFWEDPTLSATHAEYREARKCGKPIYVYVRDRLEGEFAIYKRNQDASLEWRWSGKDGRSLFGLLKEHCTPITEENHSNWFSIFRDSVELKQLVRRDFHAVASRSHLESLLEDNRIPLVGVAVSVRDGTSPQSAVWPVDVVFRNNGTMPALRLSYTLGGGVTLEAEEVPILAPNETHTRTIELRNTINGIVQWQVLATYYTAQGHRVQDRYSAGLMHMPLRLPFCHATLQNKTYFPSDGSIIPYDIASADSPTDANNK
ncbi:MAG: DUF4062 domain-containing protein [Planctomycetia bacterium]|nr:DUF4062 domain-containing protein [Planctomycetia bacterium]